MHITRGIGKVGPGKDIKDYFIIKKVTVRVTSPAMKSGNLTGPVSVTAKIT